jgi:hypothetical protein
MSEKLRSRRSFLKMAAAGAAGITVSGPAVKSVLGSPAATSAWTTGKAINPNISNNRVVCMYDPAMISNQNLATFSLSSFAGATSTTVISTDMDKMAMSLSQKATADLAWSTIFQKPAAKTWAQVVVAIKVNGCNHKNLPRTAVVGKICNVLKGLGVLAANIIVYDGANGSRCNDIGDYASYFSTTDTTKFPGITSTNSTGLGGSGSAAVPNMSNQTCPASFISGAVDIIVNISVNKGHCTPNNGGPAQGNTGGVTLCLKNHFGTFPPSHNNSNPSTGDAAVYMNMSDAIIGGTPPRQQLCIVDSLWADNNNNPDGTPTSVLSRLVMGTFAGSVDYLTSMRIKQDIQVTQLKEKNNMDTTQIARFMTLFGYATTDAVWVPITPTSVLPGASDTQKPPHAFEIRHAGSGVMTRFGLPHETTGELEVRIFDIRGRNVRKLSAQAMGNKTALSWDGKNEHGNMVGAGIYEVRVSAGKYADIGKIIVE